MGYGSCALWDLCNRCVALFMHWNGDIVILTKFSSLTQAVAVIFMKFSSLTQAVAVVVILTTSNAADDENFIKMTSTFQSILKKDIIY